MGERLVKTFKNKKKSNAVGAKKLELKWMGKKYIFSKRSIIFFFFTIPLLSILIYLFLNMSFSRWVTVMFIKQVSYLLNLVFNFETTLVITPDQIIINLPDPSLSGSVLPVCYGAQMISVFSSIMLLTPSSRDNTPKLNIIWRKTKILIITIISTYYSYMFRMVMMLGLVHYGMPMHIIHDSSYYFVTLISFMIILYTFRKILPEFIVFLHYMRYSISNKEIDNSISKKVKIKKRSNLIIELTLQKKEIYYPLFGITVCTSILYAISLFLSVYGHIFFQIAIDPYEMMLPLLLALIFLTSQYLLDVVKESTKLELTLPVLSLILFICLFFFISISVLFFMSDILNGITIVIYFTSVMMIYYFFHEEVKNYLLIKRV